MRYIFLILILFVSILGCDENKQGDNIVCDKVECSGQGKCKVLNNNAICICNDNYHAEELECIENTLECKVTEHEENNICVNNTKEVDCIDVTPDNATISNIKTEITWKNGSWSEAGSCEWECNKEYKKEDNKCILIGDITPPIITVLGEKDINIEQWRTFTDLGAVALDDIDGKVNVIISGEVNTEIIGTYNIVYKAYDTAGNQATETRIINVIKPSGNVYYVDFTNGEDGNDGKSIELAWKTLSKLKNYNFAPNDTILLKRGEVWKEQLRIQSSGEDNKNILITAYGSGNNPIINLLEPQNLTWTSIGDNIWKTTDVTYNPKRILKDNTEILDGALDFYSELGTNIPDLVEWYYGKVNSDDENEENALYMYSTDSPSNHLIEFSSISVALYLVSIHNVNIKNIEFIGGHSSCVAIYSCSNISLSNLKVGKYSNYGINITSYKEDGEIFKLSDNVIVDNCIIDSGYTFDYSQVPDTIRGRSNRGPREGFLYRGTINSELKNSFIKNYCHANINIFSPINENGEPLDERVVKNNKIHNNIITAPDIAYGGRVAIDGYCSENEIYNNLIINTAVQNQFNGFSNHIHHNIFKNVRSTALKPYPTGYGIALQGYYSEVYDNIFENNLIINSESGGILISGNNSAGDVKNNIFRNNIIYNNGNKENGLGIKVNLDSNTYSNHGNIFKNNLIFNENTLNTVFYYGSILNIEEFNLLNNDNSNTISNNIFSNPLFIDFINKDYHLQENSPCINNGTSTLSTLDYDGNIIENGTIPDIGIYESDYNTK